MVLNPQRMIDQGILFNLKDPAHQCQQNGVDLHVKEFYELTSTGTIYKERSVISERKTLIPIQCLEGMFWCFSSPGYYGVTFFEGCNLPAHVSAEIKVRSSLLRSGVIIKSGWFDSGFHTDSLGCFALVTKPIDIEEGSRIAQIVFYHSDSCKLYDGQFQNK